MKTTHLKTTFYIQSFPSKKGADKYKRMHELGGRKGPVVIWDGLVENCPPEIKERFCDWMFWDEKPERKRYYNYGVRFIVSFPFTDVNESFASALCENAKYLIIYSTLETPVHFQSTNSFDHVINKN